MYMTEGNGRPCQKILKETYHLIFVVYPVVGL
jgi:hypothetical protein